jgi:hypothetical protein
VKKFGLDDLFIAVAAVSDGRCLWLFSTDHTKMLGGLQTTTLFMQIAYGTGRHSNELNVAGFNEMLKVGDCGFILQPIGLTVVVFLAQYAHILRCHLVGREKALHNLQPLTR